MLLRLISAVVVVHASLVVCDDVAADKLKVGSIECVRITECPSLLRLFKVRPIAEEKLEFIRASRCGFDNLIEKVWCPRVMNMKETETETTDEPLLPQPLPEINITQPIIVSKSSSNMTQQNETTNELPYPSTLPPLDECGTQAYDKIFGGELTGIDEFPWVAILKYKIKNQLINGCGASLISKRYLLTAAHCITRIGPPTAVLLGEYDTNNRTDCIDNGFGGEDCTDPPQLIEVEKYEIHPNWLVESGRSFYNDIALIRLAKDAKFNDFVRPICLPVRPQINNFYYVAGWGLTENRVKSNTKLKLKIPPKSTAECARLFQRYISKGQVCAGGEAGKDTCKGDSGGPLMSLHNGTAVWSVTGIVSTGPKGCGMDGVPAIYTYVPQYIPWIYKHVS